MIHGFKSRIKGLTKQWLVLKLINKIFYWVKIGLKMNVICKKHVPGEHSPGVLANHNDSVQESANYEPNNHNSSGGDRNESIANIESHIEHNHNSSRGDGESDSRAQVRRRHERHGPGRLLHHLRHIHLALEERGADPLRLLLRDERAHHEDHLRDHVVLAHRYPLSRLHQHHQDPEHGRDRQSTQHLHAHCHHWTHHSLHVHHSAALFHYHAKESFPIFKGHVAGLAYCYRNCF